MLRLKDRLNKQECQDLFQQDNLLLLANAARERKYELHPDNKPVTFVIDRNVNYTNVCSCKCKFCAFHKDIGSEDSYVLDYDVIKKKVEELIDVEGTQFLLQGGLHPEIKIEYYFNLINSLRKDFPVLTIHAFSPTEIYYIAKQNNISTLELLQELVKRGLSSIPGGGAEILVDEIRKNISPNKISSQEWLDIMEQAHNIGLKTTATMVFGIGESQEHILEHLLKIRELQDKTGGFTAFIPWSFQISNINSFNHLNQATAYDYLKILALSRIILDNIPNIQASWVTQGLDVAQLSLNFGANDFGGTMLEENVVKAAGVEFKTTIEEIVKYIHNADFDAAQRNTQYEVLRLYPRN